jgi:hypothetical protein
MWKLCPPGRRANQDCFLLAFAEVVGMDAAALLP